MGRKTRHHEKRFGQRAARVGATTLAMALALTLSVAGAQEQLKKTGQAGLATPAPQKNQNNQQGKTTPKGKPNKLDKATVTPPLLHKQQQHYHELKALWNHRDLPAALPKPTHASQPRDSGVGAVGIEARNINFYTDDDVGYHVKRLKGELIPVKKGEPVNFDRPDQFRIHILSGEVLIRAKDMDALFNNYILRYAPRSLGSVKNHISKDTLKVDASARLFRFIPPAGGLPTSLSGPIKLGKDNWLVYTPKSVTSMGFMPLMPLLKITPLKLSTITPFHRTGIELKGNDLRFNPETIFPPPRLKIDKITKVKLTNKGMTLTFGSSDSDKGFSKLPVDSDSYIWLQGGDARFYNTVLVNANLELLSDSDAPLDFHLYDYRAQAAQGKIQMKGDGALVVRVPNKFKDTDDSPGVKQASNAGNAKANKNNAGGGNHTGNKSVNKDNGGGNTGNGDNSGGNKSAGHDNEDGDNASQSDAGGNGNTDNTAGDSDKATGNKAGGDGDSNGGDKTGDNG